MDLRDIKFPFANLELNEKTFLALFGYFTIQKYRDYAILNIGRARGGWVLSSPLNLIL